MSNKTRLDVLLVERGLEQTRQRAQAMIMSGLVFVDGQRVDKAGTAVPNDAQIEVRGNTLRYVSRGGLKLEKAMTTFGLKLDGCICADIGASTGGFTDCMLQNGATKVYAVDVGYGQLDWKLRSDERVVCMERTNARYLDRDQIPDELDFASIDVSFISLKLILPAVHRVLKEGGHVACLIKPQFEAGREKVGKKGVVRDPDVHLEVLENFLTHAKDSGFTVLDITFSPIRGPEGNIEYLGYLESGDWVEKTFDLQGLVEQSHAALDHGKEGGMLRKVILCPNPYRDAQLRVAKEAKRVLDEVGCPNVVCLPFRNQEPPEGYGLNIEPLQQEIRGADMIIAFGGDGTILHLSKTAAHRDIPVLGVNLGSLGFMAELESKDLLRLRDLCDGKYEIESHMMLDVSVQRDGRVIYSNLALNEALIARGNISRVIRLQIFTEQGKLVDVAGDGVIVASPTGSTAYSLSAGGPVVEPTARNFIVSPICAHSVHANAYVLSPERVITVQTEKNSYKPVLLSVDGGRAFSLRSGDSIEVRRSKFDTKLVRLSKRSFCEILQKKMLMGGTSNEE